MNERLKQIAIQAKVEHCISHVRLQEFAELIIKDMANELFVVYPGGKRDSDVAFQNISMKQWIKQVYGVDE